MSNLILVQQIEELRAAKVRQQQETIVEVGLQYSGCLQLH